MYVLYVQHIYPNTVMIAMIAFTLFTMDLETEDVICLAQIQSTIRMCFSEKEILLKF
jgi:hypothetical protein